jgi:hypothetical protein
MIIENSATLFCHNFKVYIDSMTSRILVATYGDGGIKPEQLGRRS